MDVYLLGKYCRRCRQERFDLVWDARGSTLATAASLVVTKREAGRYHLLLGVSGRYTVPDAWSAVPVGDAARCRLLIGAGGGSGALAGSSAVERKLCHGVRLFLGRRRISNG